MGLEEYQQQQQNRNCEGLFDFDTKSDTTNVQTSRYREEVAWKVSISLSHQKGKGWKWVSEQNKVNHTKKGWVFFSWKNASVPPVVSHVHYCVSHTVLWKINQQVAVTEYIRINIQFFSQQWAPWQTNQKKFALLFLFYFLSNLSMELASML